MASRQLIKQTSKVSSLHNYVVASYQNSLRSSMFSGLYSAKTIASHQQQFQNYSWSGMCPQLLYQSQPCCNQWLAYQFPKHLVFLDKQSRELVRTYASNQVKTSTGNLPTSHKHPDSKEKGSQDSEKLWLLKKCGALVLGTYVVLSLYRREARNELKTVLDQDHSKLSFTVKNVGGSEYQYTKERVNNPETLSGENEAEAKPCGEDNPKLCFKSVNCLERCPQPPCTCLPAHPCQKQKQKQVSYSCKTGQSDGKPKIGATPCVMCPPPPCCDNQTFGEPQLSPRKANIESLSGQRESTNAGVCNRSCKPKRSCDGLNDRDYVIL